MLRSSKKKSQIKFVDCPNSCDAYMKAREYFSTRRHDSRSCPRYLDKISSATARADEHVSTSPIDDAQAKCQF
jgi:hypothetical protein